jgi:transposase
MSRPVFVRELTQDERKELTRLIHSNGDARIVRRAQMIRLSAEGKTASQIAALWDVTGEGVRRILHRFNAEGLGGLADRPRPGRPRKRTDRYVALLKEAVQTSPRDLGYPFSAWTLERLREHLARQTHILLSPPHLSRLLSENDIVYRRPKHGMEHLRDPQEYDEKKAFLEFVKRGRHAPEPPSSCSTSMSVRFISTRP